MDRPRRRTAILAHARIAPWVEVDEEPQTVIEECTTKDHDTCSPDENPEIQDLDDDVAAKGAKRGRAGKRPAKAAKGHSQRETAKHAQSIVGTPPEKALSIDHESTKDSIEDKAQSRSTRYGRRRHGEGTREDNVINLLGDHVPLDYAMSQRSAWGPAIIGPSRSLIARYHGNRAPSSTAGRPAETTQKESQLHNFSDLGAYVHPGRTVNVQFVAPETLETIYVAMPIFHVFDTASMSNHKSFTIHTGLSNRAVSWLATPNECQFLAIGGLPLDHSPTRLFHFEGGPGCVQIWSVQIGTPRYAHLDILYVHDFGHAWDLKWCPTIFEDDSALGLLAGVFNDGSIRVWFIRPRDGQNTEPEYRKLNVPAYTFSAPDASCTVLDWISDTKLAAGCANGMFFVWDLEYDLQCPVSTGSPHTTFINTITACGPGAEEVLLTSSWDCDVRLSDYRNPEVEYLPAPRERMNIYAAAWSEFLNCAIVNEDSNSVKLVSMRGGYTANLATVKGTVTALATNPFHPFLAIGDASGSLIILNTCRKAMWKKLPQYKRRVYRLDWAKDEDAYRFTENYKIDESLGKMESKKFFVTNIYPEEVNVTKAAWNSNPGFEGLLASCTTSFVRIDDMTAP